MKVEDLFRIGEKTVFTGTMETGEKAISNALCAIEIDGNRVEEIVIAGEVHTGKPYRDLWTASPVGLNREALGTHEVWLISA